MSEGGWDTPEVRGEVREAIKRRLAELKIEKADAPYPEENKVDRRDWRAESVAAQQAADREYLASVSPEKDAVNIARLEAMRLAKLSEELDVPVEKLEAANIPGQIDMHEPKHETKYEAPDFSDCCFPEPEPVYLDYLNARLQPPDPKKGDWIEAEIRERANAVFLSYIIDSTSFGPGTINSWVKLDERLEAIDEEKIISYGLRLDLQHYRATNRVLTILLIFSTAFGVAAALAWLRCQ